jgi:hypothetical protein
LYKLELTYEYHVRNPSHNIDTCLAFKAGWISFEDTPNINQEEALVVILTRCPIMLLVVGGVNAVEYREKKKHVLRVTMDRLYNMLMQAGYLTEQV